MFEYSENHSANELEEIFSSTKQDLEKIKKDNAETQEKGIIDAPKFNNGAVVFDYEQGWNTREIVSRKEWNQYKIRVKKRINNQWFTQKNWDSETFNFISPDELSFNQQLWKILDTVIGNNRYRIPKTWNKVYDFLNRWQTSDNNKEKNTEKAQKKWEKKQERNLKQKEQWTNRIEWAPEWLSLDNWVYIYTVKKWDTLGWIKLKLQNFSPLSYLSWEWYWISAWTWFNISKIAEKVIQPWMEIPVPIEHTKRKKTVSEFKNSAKSAIADMKNNWVYKNKINDLIKTYWENTIVNMMVAYAKSESSPDSLNGMIGHFALYRWEQNHNCASYWYYHILKEWAWWRAFKNLGMTVWQSFDPKNSWKLFLAYCCEFSNYKDFFNVKDFKTCARIYNWAGYVRNNYDTKLQNNYNYVKNIK